jgi:hypothetical protein
VGSELVRDQPTEEEEAKMKKMKKTKKKKEQTTRMDFKAVVIALAVPVRSIAPLFGGYSE